MSNKEDPERLTLRAKPQPVKRLNRRVIVVLAAGLAAAVLLATLWSLRKHSPAVRSTTESHNVERLPRAEGLDALPRDYAHVSKVPQLGAPIGDLGRPVLRAERDAGIPPLPPQANFMPNAQDDALRAARLKEEDEVKQALKSKVFFQLSQRHESDRGTVPQDGTVPRGEGASRSATLPDPLNALQTPKSPFQVMAGTIIPAALQTGINSDLPGQIIATITKNIFDTVSGQTLLIPQGSRLLGRYDSKVAYGQRRVQMLWTRLIMPDGSSIVLDELPGTDASGQAGLEDRVDWHWDRIFAGAALSTLIGVGAELAAPDRREDSEGRVIIAARDSVQDTVNQVGQQLTQRNLNIQPTLTIRAGFPVRIVVGRDLTLRPYVVAE